MRAHGRRALLQLCAYGSAFTALGCVDEQGPIVPRLHPFSPEGRHLDSGAVDAGEDTTAVDSGGDEAEVDASEADATIELDVGIDAEDAASCDDFVLVYDTYAQALYYDGTYGPLTGTITATAIAAADELTLDFWHGHGGVLHRFTVTHEHFLALQRGERVTIGTSIVEDHSHTLFIDPVDPAYRVPSAEPVRVDLC